MPSWNTCGNFGFDLSEDSLLREAHLMEGTMICHLHVAGLEACQNMDEHLSSLAHAYWSVRFVRVPLSLQSGLLPQLCLPHEPALLVFKAGAVLAKAPLHVFTRDKTLLEEQVTKWLRRNGSIAADDQPAAHKRASKDSSGSSSGDDDGDWIEPCLVCGRRYYHEHVRNLQTGGVLGDSDSDE
ncbi:hypothetical protein WJX72_008784 [[Myrmecia] bisecta]|uniref:Thioredoxin domain-containing protein n=1 Tax=[Myrmecia] bisecta TaxID=41462 RepID=A0AAW1QRV5_9CHLO